MDGMIGERRVRDSTWLPGPQVAKKLRRTRGAVAQKAMLLGVRFRSVNRKRR